MTTLANASTSVEQCVCDEGYFDAGNRSCEPCFSGTDCKGTKGIAISTLPIVRGYWRPGSSTVDVRRCPDANAGCTDVHMSCANSTSACLGGADLMTRCADGLDGVLCRLCATDRDINGSLLYYIAASDNEVAHCASCQGNNDGRVALGVIAVLLLCPALVCCTTASVPSPTKKYLKAWLAGMNLAFTFKIKLKILLSFYLILGHAEAIYGMSLQGPVGEVLQVFATPLNFGLSSMDRLLTCIGYDRYLHKLLVCMAIPPLLYAIILIYAACYLACTRQCSRVAMLELSLPYMLHVTFFAVPLLSNIAFQALEMHDFGPDGRWLKVDVYYRAGTDEYQFLVKMATVAAAMCVGMIAVPASLLFIMRRKLLIQDSTPFSRSVEFLHRDYEPRMYWWDIVEALRRFVLCGVMVVVEAGTVVQLSSGATLCALYLAVQAHIKPYREASDGYLATSCSMLLLVFFLAGIIQRHGHLMDQSNLRAILSMEQESAHSVNPDWLRGVLLGSMLGTLAICVLLVAIQAWLRAAQAQRQAQKYAARRLRFEKDDSLVRISSKYVLSNGYHLYISRVWEASADIHGTQGEMPVLKQALLEMIPDVKCFLDADDQDDSSDAEGCLARSKMMLVHCTRGYFRNRSCMRDLRYAVAEGKPLIAVIDYERDGLSTEEVRAHLIAGDRFYKSWGFVDSGPRGRQLFDALFANDPIEWSRDIPFRDVSVRLIAVRLLPRDHGTTYVQSSLLRQCHKTRPPGGEMKFHVYCSPSNRGAKWVMAEVEAAQRVAPHSILVTEQVEALHHCEHMLVYLNEETWTGGAMSERFAEEVQRAMKMGVHLLLAHETVGVEQKSRRGVPFSTLLASPSGATPPHLLKAGIYKQAPTALKGGEWRTASLAMLAKVIAAGVEVNQRQRRAAAAAAVEQATLKGPSSPPLMRRRSSSIYAVQAVASLTRAASPGSFRIRTSRVAPLDDPYAGTMLSSHSSQAAEESPAEDDNKCYLELSRHLQEAQARGALLKTEFVDEASSQPYAELQAQLQAALDVAAELEAARLQAKAEARLLQSKLWESSDENARMRAETTCTQHLMRGELRQTEQELLATHAELVSSSDLARLQAESLAVFLLQVELTQADRVRSDAAAAMRRGIQETELLQTELHAAERAASIASRVPQKRRATPHRSAPCLTPLQLPFRATLGRVPPEPDLAKTADSGPRGINNPVTGVGRTQGEAERLGLSFYPWGPEGYPFLQQKEADEQAAYPGEQLWRACEQQFLAELQGPAREAFSGKHWTASHGLDSWVRDARGKAAWSAKTFTAAQIDALRHSYNETFETNYMEDQFLDAFWYAVSPLPHLVAETNGEAPATDSNLDEAPAADSGPEGQDDSQAPANDAGELEEDANGYPSPAGPGLEGKADAQAPAADYPRSDEQADGKAAADSAWSEEQADDEAASAESGPRGEDAHGEASAAETSSDAGSANLLP